MIELQDILTEIREIRQLLHSQNETLIKNTASLEHHVKRTDELQDLYKKTDDKVEAIDKKITFFEGALWVAGGIIALILGYLQISS